MVVGATVPAEVAQPLFQFTDASLTNTPANVAFGKSTSNLAASFRQPKISSRTCSDRNVKTEPMLRDMLGPFENMERMITLCIYSALMLFAIVGPGLTAMYYQSRRKFIEQYANESARWITDLQRAGMTVY